MSIVLNWKVPSLIPTGITIWKSTTPFSATDRPTQKVELPGTATTWTDNDVQLDRSYYYRIGNRYGTTDVVVSDMVHMKSFSNAGVGGSEILIGDAEFGFMGVVTQEDFITNPELFALTDMNVTGAAIAYDWYKWCCKGKILLTPSKAVSSSMSINILAQLGLVWGGEGPDITGITGQTVKSKVISVDRNKYIVRLPRISDGESQVSTTLNTPGEVRDFISRVYIGTNNNASVNVTVKPPLVAINAGQMASGTQPNIHIAAVDATGRPQRLLGNALATSGNGFWLPVLELTP